MRGCGAQLTAALDKKEALLQQLRAMNDEATAGSHVDPVTKRHSESFQRAYAGVVLELTKARACESENFSSRNLSIYPYDTDPFQRQPI